MTILNRLTIDTLIKDLKDAKSDIRNIVDHHDRLPYREVMPIANQIETLRVSMTLDSIIRALEFIRDGNYPLIKDADPELERILDEEEHIEHVTRNSEFLAGCPICERTEP